MSHVTRHLPVFSHLLFIIIYFIYLLLLLSFIIHIYCICSAWPCTRAWITPFCREETPRLWANTWLRASTRCVGHATSDCIYLNVKQSILIIAVMFIYIFIRLHGIDRRKLEKNTALPVLWIPLQIFEKVMIFF